MTITISPSLEGKVRGKAAAEGVSVDTYVEQLIHEDGWSELEADTPGETSGDLEEIRSAVSEGLAQIERGEGRPAREVFAELRAKHVVSR